MHSQRHAPPFLHAAQLLMPMFLAVVLAACGSQKPATPESDTVSTASGENSGQVSRHAILRVPTGSRAPDGLARAISAGKADGQITHALWLDSIQDEKAGFSSVATVEFRNPEAMAAWRSANASLLALPLEMHSADLLFRVENSGRDSAVAVFQGNYMKPKVSRDAFVDFADRYMRKYLELQREADILTAYAMYLEQPAPHGTGLAFMIREHKDQETFDDRNATKDQLRVDLMARDADYKKLEDTAIEYREHVSSTRARDVPLP